MRLAIALMTAALLAACGGSSSGFPGGSHADGGASHPSTRGYGATVADAGAATPTLRVASGAGSVTVRIVPSQPVAVRALTPSTSNVRPVLTKESAGVVTLTLASVAGGGGGGPADVAVVLSATPVWNVELTGGATEETVDATGGRVGTVDFVAGTTRATVRLAARSGTQHVREEGGATEFTVTAPGSVAANVEVGGGASELDLAGVAHHGIGGDQTFQTPGYAGASERVGIDLVGGVSRITVR